MVIEDRSMDVRQFQDLTEIFKKKTIDFLMDADPEHFNDPGQTMNYIKGPIYSDGGGLLTLWEHNVIIGTLGVIVRDAQSSRKIYFHHLHTNDCHPQKMTALMDTAFKTATRFPGCTFLIGFNPNDRVLKQVVTAKGFKKAHQVLIMTYTKTLEECLQMLKRDHFQFEPMSETSWQTFIDVTNRAFKNTLNSGDIDDRDIRQMMKTSPETLLGICYYNKIPMGTYELLPGKIGWINNIGVIPDHWGKGIGTELVCWSIAKLLNLGADHVKLKVIDSNDRAFQIYQHLGFKIETVTSEWFIKEP